MSELYMSDPPGSAYSRHQQQQESRTQAETAARARIPTPRQIMAARNAREARKADIEARQRQTQEVDSTRRRQQDDVVGVGFDPRRQQAQQQAYSEAEVAARIPAGQSVTIGGRSDLIPTSNGTAPRTGNTVVNQGQPRPVPGQQTQTQPSTQIQRDRTEAFDKLNMPAVAGSRPMEQQDPDYLQQSSNTQQLTRAGFPHAFQRWEDLSSHWEGLTSYWIRRLQQNTDELDSKPIDKQMARQITDLSAAGANLFHAVVELQRLRASSERKFQRWFVDTRAEQEQAREKMSQIEAQLQSERQNRTRNTESSASLDAMRAEKNKAEELVREMRRELQISKEEARRAWEELGRREQEERERTIALRSGEATLIGGVQVLPMQPLSSRHNTTASARPATRDGPYTGGPTATLLGGQQPESRSQTTLESPTQEQAHFTYQPETTSPTDTDPFTEPTRRSEPPVPLRHEPDTRFLSTQSPTSQQSRTPQNYSTARGATASPAHSQRSAHNRSAVSDAPSYNPSTRSGAESVQSEEEYHLGPDGRPILDPHGRPIPYRQPMIGYEDIASDDEDHTADMEREQMLSEQYAQRQQATRWTSTGQANLPPASRSPQPQSAYAQATTTPQMQQTGFSEISPETHRSTSSTVSPVTPQPATLSGRLASPPSDPVDYEGAAYGEQETYGSQQQQSSTTPPSGTPGTTARQHHVPTRLSDILEERTEPSRSSVISAGASSHGDNAYNYNYSNYYNNNQPPSSNPYITPQGGLFGAGAGSAHDGSGRR